MEAPDGGEPTSALPKFTPVNFTSALACTQSGQATGNPQSANFINVRQCPGNNLLTSVTLGNDT